MLVLVLVLALVLAPVALHETLRNDKAFTTGVAMKLLQLLITLRAKEKSFVKFDDASYLP